MVRNGRYRTDSERGAAVDEDAGGASGVPVGAVTETGSEEETEDTVPRGATKSKVERLTMSSGPSGNGKVKGKLRAGNTFPSVGQRTAWREVLSFWHFKQWWSMLTLEKNSVM